jgi:uncharacterized protein DUF6885
MRLSSEPLTAGESAQHQQKDSLCGPYHAARVLRNAGVTTWNGAPVDQDLVAVHAGASLPRYESGPQVPPGAVSHRDYRHELLRGDPERAGTRAPGLAAAIEEISAGELVSVPFSGQWSPAAVEDLLVGIASLSVRLIANLRTGLLWGSRPPLEALLAALDGAELSDPPAADWDVGHYVELVQLLRGRGGALVLVQDSYPSLGWNGMHLQPPAAVAAALLRRDGRGGGVLAVAPVAAASAVEELAPKLGLEIEIWDN